MKVCLILLLSIGLAASVGMEGVEYLLWTRSNLDTEEILVYNDLESLSSSNFDGSKKTYFAYHGWTNTGRQDFIIAAKDSILDIEDANFISVDWDTLADSPIYNPSVNKLYEVAEQTANYIVFLSEQTGLSPDNIHVWGHSLGAHASGMTGHYYSDLTGQLIGRITGMDPAGIGFENVEASMRIDRTSGVFVDVIHTNAGKLIEGCVGLAAAIGHVDFYPNGGAHQPNCADSGGGADLIDLFAGCSHGMANDFFIESIVGSPPFTSAPCASYESYEAGDCDCGQGCLDMGFHVGQNLLGDYYLRTNSEKPYAQG